MTKREYQQKINSAKTIMDLYQVAGFLNNHKEHVLKDKVTIMGFMSFAEAKAHCESLLAAIKSLN